MDCLPNAEDVIELAEKAGKAICDIYSSDDFGVKIKEDKSPLTKADLLSQKILLTGLREICPNIPVVSEESSNEDYEERKNWKYCWCIDPLDGTKEFIGRNGEFTINIALLKDSKPFFGLIHIPCTGISYYAVEDSGAFKCEEGVISPLRKQANNSNKINVVASRSHITDMEYEYADMLKEGGYDVELKQYGAALKQCMLAEGTADIYPKYGNCYEWDTAAGDIILRESGGGTADMYSLNELKYNKRNLKNPEFIMFSNNVKERINKGEDCFFPHTEGIKQDY